MNQIEPSQRQQEILAFIREYLSEHGYPPTVRDIMRGMGYSGPFFVHRSLQMLEQKGWIERTPGVARGLRVLA